MHWWYVFISQNDNIIKYAYSCESKELDGVILYDSDTESWEVSVPCSLDAGRPRAIERPCEHFCSVVSEGFPKERHVCCG